jgi:hypothetical protein
MSQSLTGLRYDMTWNAFIVWIWLVVECNLAIICISVPVLRVFVKKFKARRKSGKLEKGPVPPILSPGFKPNNASMSSLAHDTRSVRNHDIEMNGRRGSLTSLGPHNPIIGYDRYGQPILREEKEEEQIGIAQAV